MPRTNLNSDTSEAEEIELEETDHDLIVSVHRCETVSMGGDG